MKPANHKGHKCVALASSRWAAYATASAATMFGGATIAEADIHYSGLINSEFRLQRGKIHRAFPLENGASLFFHLRESHLATSAENSAFFGIKGAAVSNRVRGTNDDHHDLFGYVSRLGLGVKVSQEPFFHATVFFGAAMARNYYGSGYWQEPGYGFVGFKFNTGAGAQYGWARVKTTGNPYEFFIVIDYAWGDPGDPITTGQKALQESPAQVSESGSLGLLALGGAGLLAWRRRRHLGVAKK